MYRRYREISSLDLPDLDGIKPVVTFYRVVPAIIRLRFIYHVILEEFAVLFKVLIFKTSPNLKERYLSIEQIQNHRYRYICKPLWITDLLTTNIIWASLRQNLSSGFPTRSYPKQPAQLQRLARTLKLHLSYVEIWYFPISEKQRRWSDCADGQALCTFVVPKPPKTSFFLSRPIRK